MTRQPASLTGELTRWDDDRGFGFITPLDGRADVFLHIFAFPRTGGRPRLGDLLNFAVERTDDGKRRAAQVELIRTTATAARTPTRRPAGRQPPASRAAGVLLGLAVVATFATVVVVVSEHWSVPGWIAPGYLALSILCFVVYASDKSAAVSGRWRISENTLLGLGLLGGWPGAIIAQQVLRHKIRKRRFMIVFAGTVVANVSVLTVALSPLGAPTLSALVTALF